MDTILIYGMTEDGKIVPILVDTDGVIQSTAE